MVLGRWEAMLLTRVCSGLGLMEGRLGFVDCGVWCVGL